MKVVVNYKVKLLYEIMYLKLKSFVEIRWKIMLS
jgi:hypothetical protein